MQLVQLVLVLEEELLLEEVCVMLECILTLCCDRADHLFCSKGIAMPPSLAAAPTGLAGPVKGVGGPGGASMIPGQGRGGGKLLL